MPEMPGGQTSTNLGVAALAFSATQIVVDHPWVAPLLTHAMHDNLPTLAAGCVAILLRDRPQPTPRAAIAAEPLAAGPAAPPKEIPMSDTQAAAPAATPETAAPDWKAHIAQSAATLFKFVESTGTVWQQIKASPAFPVIKNLIVDAATSALGAPAAGSLVNLDRVAEAELDSLAAASATISTPSS